MLYGKRASWPAVESGAARKGGETRTPARDISRIFKYVGRCCVCRCMRSAVPLPSNVTRHIDKGPTRPPWVPLIYFILFFVCTLGRIVAFPPGLLSV